MKTESIVDRPHLTTESLARRYGVTVETARDWLRGRRPKFGYIRLGRDKLVPWTEVVRYEAANLVPGQGAQVVSDERLAQISEVIAERLKGGAR